MTTPPLTDQQRADIITRHHRTTDPEACGTCRDLTTAHKAAIHPECRRRATLAPAWDAPDLEDMTDDERTALPARFHTPAFVESSTPKAWLCAVCWGDGWATSWPCETATAQGHRVFVPERYAGQVQSDLGALLTDRDRLAAELDAARAETDRLRQLFHSARDRADNLATEGDNLRRQLAEDRDRSAKQADQLIDARAALAAAVGCPQHGHDCEPDDHIDPHAHQ
ncbi:hypothetical protein [Kitasatospora sp. NPDC057223]|uniref:hypothetical protein n=1 Tax=Kitasatospora sp. NPDC057223 TaxID=3346055 RepID=UPI003628F2BD